MGVLRWGPLLPLKGGPINPLRVRGSRGWIGIVAAASACGPAANKNSPVVACGSAPAPHAAAAAAAAASLWPSRKPQEAALLLLPAPERLKRPSGPLPACRGAPGPPSKPRSVLSQGGGLSDKYSLLGSSCILHRCRRGSLLNQQRTGATTAATRWTHQQHSSRSSTAFNSSSRSRNISTSDSSSSSNSSNSSSSRRSSRGSKDKRETSDHSPNSSMRSGDDDSHVSSSHTSLWSMLIASVWPTSPGLRARVVAAVASLMAAKCLTIAAPIALAAVVDHFTQSAAAGAAAAATAAAADTATAIAAAAADTAAATTTAADTATATTTAADTAAATTPAADTAVTTTTAAEDTAAATTTAADSPAGALLHPALPIALVLGYPLARLGASGK
ncbi:hypothetical protein ACSSS7_005031 [Eimeria intestinalis]